MRNHLLPRLLVIALLSALLLIVSQALATPVLADDPFITEETWEGHVWNPDPFDSRTFTAPPGAVRVEILAEWKWSGSSNKIQRNEAHEVRVNGHNIRCADYGNHEFDQNGDGVGDNWISCGAVGFGRQRTNGAGQP